MPTQKTNRRLAVHLGLCALVAACGGSESESHLSQRDDATGGQAPAALVSEETKALGESALPVAKDDSINQNNSFIQAPSAFRNSQLYNLANEAGRYVTLAVLTNPAQQFAPVYSWRTHMQGALPGPHGYNGGLVGYTNQYGVYELAGYMPFDESLCGTYTNETFAVGSMYGPRSSPLSFRIFVSPSFGPYAPGCRY